MIHIVSPLVLSSLAQFNVLKNFKFFVMCIKNSVLFIANKYFIMNFTICWSTYLLIDQFSSAPLLSRVRLFVTPWTAAHLASLFITNSQSLLKLMSIRSVIPSNHLNLCHPLLLLPSIFPVSESFLMRQFFTSGGQSIGVAASASVLPMNIQDWFPLGWTGWIALQSKGLSRVFSNTTNQKHLFFGVQLSWNISSMK